MKCSLFVVLCFAGFVNCANILAVIPTLSKSHFVMFEVLLTELVKRNHTVTSITTFPQETPIRNLREISLKPVRKVVFNDFPLDYFKKVPETFTDVAFRFFEYIDDTEKVLNFTDVTDLINSSESFDLIIYETFVDDLFLGFAHRFKAPVISISSCYMFPWIADRFAIPANPAYVPGFYSHFSNVMTFYQRLQNTLLDISNRMFFKYLLAPKTTKLLKKYFDKDVPSVDSLVQNISLYFINTHFSFYGARPFPPQVVDISGLHLKPSRPLPQELDRWMNESPAGVVYFSFGSMLRGATLPTDKVKAFLRVFSTLKQRVLWKWEDDTVDDLPTNVKIMKWLPQRDILGHPKTRVFISHGGLLGTTEAVVSGVPILGIPMYGDQPNNVAALVENRVAIHVDYNNISVASLSYALNTLLNDKSFAENAQQLSRRFLDRPMSPLDTAVYWTEYVIRHKGAPHLRSAAVHMPWYQYYLLDVIAFCLFTLLSVVFAICITLRAVLRIIYPAKTTKLKSN